MAKITFNMKTIYSILIAITFFSLNLNAQLPELVVDFNVGSDDGFSNWNYEGEYLGDDIIIPIISSSVGEELAIISDGQVSILKDIYPGTEGSEPRDFTLYKGEIYFAAKASEDNFELWKTNGTADGTQMVFDPGTSTFARPSAFVVGQNEWMYFGYDGKIFRTDGTTHEEIYDGATLGFDFANASQNYCAYKNGIAFLHKNDDDSFSILAIDDDEAVELARTAETEFFADGFGLATVTDGLMFSINDSDVDGIYVYNENDQSLTILPIENENLPSRRTINFNDDINISWIGTKGYYIVNGKQNEEQSIFATNNNSATQGERILYTKYNDKAVFVVSEGFWGEEYLMISDGTVAGTENLTELQSYQSNIAAYNEYAYIASGVSNLFEPDLYQVNLATGEFELLHAFTESSNNIESVRPIGVQNNKLYFLSNLDATIGLELYSIQLDIASSTNDLFPGLDFNLVQIDNSLEIKMKQTENLQIAIYNTSGTLLFNRSLQSNEPFDIDFPTGIYYLHIEQDKKQASIPFHLLGN